MSNSIIAVILLQATFVLDFFYYEGWYLRTIDIAHDHFGFYLAWGDTVWLPMMYTLQELYLSYNPVVLSTPSFVAVLTLGWLGFGVFRAVNNQKDVVRKANGRCKVWGAPARFIEVQYETRDGPRKSLLITCGFWGLSRHFNYVGDLLLSSAMCLACGTSHVLPYFYIVYMALLLVHRVGRDEVLGQVWQGVADVLRPCAVEDSALCLLAIGHSVGMSAVKEVCVAFRRTCKTHLWQRVTSDSMSCVVCRQTGHSALLVSIGLYSIVTYPFVSIGRECGSGDAPSRDIVVRGNTAH